MGAVASLPGLALEGVGKPFQRGLVWAWPAMGLAAMVHELLFLAYHRSYALPLLLQVAAASLIVLSLLGLFVGARWGGGGWVARGLSWLLLLMVSKSFAAHLGLRASSQWELAAALALLGAAGVCWADARRFAAALRFAGTACLLYGLSFPTMALLNVAPASTVFALDWTAAGDQAQVVLLLDEFDPAYLDRLTRLLAQRHVPYRAAAVAAAGRHTVNAIPAMLTGRSFDPAYECGPDTLCAGQGLDFSRLVAARPDVDVVGFSHPYCAIRGLRSCAQQQGVFLESRPVSAELGCAVLPMLGRLLPCEAFPNELAQSRQAMQDKLFAAPFWQRGGLLYVHIPLPHPSGTGAGGGLQAEYEANLVQAMGLVDRVLAQLRARFGERFSLIVTADHPLRVDMWCAAPAYAGPGCGKGLARSDGLVPLVIASDAQLPARLPSSNVGLLR